MNCENLKFVRYWGCTLKKYLLNVQEEIFEIKNYEKLLTLIHVLRILNFLLLKMTAGMHRNFHK